MTARHRIRRPALLFALKIHKKATALGFDVDGAVPSVDAALAAAKAAKTGDEAAVGDLLMAAVALARRVDVDPETALRAAAARLSGSARAAELASD